MNAWHSKKCWVILTQLWVKYGQTQPLGYIFFNYIFNPTFAFAHIWPKVVLKQPSIFVLIGCIRNVSRASALIAAVLMDSSEGHTRVCVWGNTLIEQTLAHHVNSWMHHTHLWLMVGLGNRPVRVSCVARVCIHSEYFEHDRCSTCE